ncbi:MAG: flagellar basal body rod protein FlgB [Pirellulales bacterium]
MSVIPSQFGILSKLLDASALRHRAVSQNLANVNTPGYRRLEVSFEEELASQMSGSSAVDVSRLNPEMIESAGLPVRADGNNVDIDVEMGQMNKNALLYQTYTQVLASKIGTMRSAITGR